MNPRWNIWVHSSINKHMKAVALANGAIPIIMEGIDDRTDNFMEQAHFVEVRVTGPHIRQMSKDYFLLNVDLNIFVTSNFGEVGSNRYEQNRIVGVFQNTMEDRIPIYRYGTEDEDDGTELGCLSPIPKNNDFIRAFHFGQVNDTDRKKQAAVDAKYYMNLRT